jgi:hypothetical protein
MFDEDDFVAVSKFLKLGVIIKVKNPMGQSPNFSTQFPKPKGGMVTIDESSLYDVERALRALLSNDTPVRTKITPFIYLGTNFRGILFCSKGLSEFVIQETHNEFGIETNKIVRKADNFVQLLR